MKKNRSCVVRRLHHVDPLAAERRGEIVHRQHHPLLTGGKKNQSRRKYGIMNIDMDKQKVRTFPCLPLSFAFAPAAPGPAPDAPADAP
jgi:hypothetical protein